MQQYQNIVVAVSALVVGALLGAGAGYYIGFDRGWEGSLAAKEAEEKAENAVNPFAEVETNPLEGVKTNPYEDVRLNPFD